MAQYYERRYKIASENAQLRSRSQQTPIAPEEDEDGSIHESFYIFPSPSGPSCPTNPSIYFPDYSPSMATTLSPSSEISSVDGSSLPTPIVLTPMEGTEGSDSWEWPIGAEYDVTDHLLLSVPGRTNLWKPKLARKPLEPRSESPLKTGMPAHERWKDSTEKVAFTESSIQLPSRIPLLSFFATLLPVDEATHKMITTPSASSLFAWSASPPAEVRNTVPRSEKVASAENIHGIGKFIVSMSEELHLFHGPVNLRADFKPSPLTVSLSGMFEIFAAVGE